MVDWGLADPYYKWIDSFKDAAAQGLVSNGTEITPAPYLEVKAANGTWLRVAQDIPLPSDYRLPNLHRKFNRNIPRKT